MHSLSYDEGRALLTAVQQGYWSMADFRAFERDFRAHDASIRAKRRSYRVLALCHDFPVQSVEISKAFGVMFTSVAATHDARHAIVAGSVLNKMQVRRALPFDNVQVFSDASEATDWLFAGDAGTEATLPDGSRRGISPTG